MKIPFLPVLLLCFGACTQGAAVKTNPMDTLVKPADTPAPKYPFRDRYRTAGRYVDSMVNAFLRQFPDTGAESEDYNATLLPENQINAFTDVQYLAFVIEHPEGHLQNCNISVPIFVAGMKHRLYMRIPGTMAEEFPTDMRLKKFKTKFPGCFILLDSLLQLPLQDSNLICKAVEVYRQMNAKACIQRLMLKVQQDAHGFWGSCLMYVWYQHFTKDCLTSETGKSVAALADPANPEASPHLNYTSKRREKLIQEIQDWLKKLPE
ncbi:MAG: hypothetical protein JNL57_07015 [Bacteroidetes bacterium]|nr:hypothetical protein [Bacteroidota bacterium]